MLIEQLEILAIVRHQQLDAEIAQRHGRLAAIPEQHPFQLDRLLQIDLPPRVFFSIGVKAPLAVLHAIHGTRRICLTGYDRGRRGEASRILEPPIGFHLGLPSGIRRSGGSGTNRTKHKGT